ncbi:molecular chaperone GrpE [Streptoalloteichus tenebrarius]|uniref:Protein GrpE n=1 Tax=Streptoalloteichus tenebrarius (strain ATCC 17920 / DSM 40477 / JCM 4838 / CBS 697.72 / NBRC 16177 / NCIMB 11028 / NRRL B-12390 / A12253. 1 / ISP 5477) TaxID=1933 RepID=A0ABT1I2I8_STRSD|nr:nucleotide exchange factor GrpE [Streptoalloteichus tenebrarius]MCP2261996.1 molecular chaperone GrpE [Streptoalloteichus tenebrarius]BFF02115.1 nucleotide exchange factor GrpE [Streptoalloteichus tenebrarius]
MTQPQHEGHEGEPRVVVRDRRRIDPETGAVRAPDAGEQPAPGGAPGDQRPEAGEQAPAEAPAGASAGAEVADAAVADLRRQLDERTADLQRVTAEYANYRKRVERDRELVVTTAKAQVVTELLSVLDDFERAEQHGDLTGAFKAVADKIVSTLHKAGLEPFGAEGDEFDPSVHEAVQHSTSPEVSGPTVTMVLRRGYRFGERVLRPALVAVTDHEPEPFTPEAPVAPGIPERPDGANGEN